jgi:hypothetical protein
VSGLTQIATKLLDVVPGTEPPLGFDRAVLARVTTPSRRATTVVLASVAAALVCALLVGGAVLIAHGPHHPSSPAYLVAALREGGVNIGTFVANGHPLWVSVAVSGADVSGPVACQLMSRSGSVETLGLFDLLHGTGSWAAPHPAGIKEDEEARLIDRTGRVFATGTLP